MSIEVVRALVSDLVIDDRGISDDVADHAVHWKFSLGVDRTTELEVVLEDPGLRLFNSAPMARGAKVAWRDLDLVIAARQIDRGTAQEAVHLFCRSAGVQTLRRPTKGPKVWRNVALHELIQHEAAAVGLGFYGETSSPRRTSISRQAPTGTSATGKKKKTPFDSDIAKWESDWDVFQRAAAEEGKLCFESEGVVVLARPTWLVEHAGTREDARLWRWPAPAQLTAHEDPLIDVPTCHESDDSAAKVITGQLYLDDAIRYRPGHAVEFDGIRDFAGLYLVGSVEAEPGEVGATVEILTPIDPTVDPTPAGEKGAAAAAGGGSGVVGAPPASSGPVPAPPIGGSYGYQYDSVGSRCLGGVQPGAAALAQFVVANFPGTRCNIPGDIYACRPNTANTSQKSVHSEGRALDIFVPVRSELGDRLSRWLVENADRIGIQLVIWNHRDWSSRTRTWTSYGGPNPHIDHNHVELCWQAARTLSAAQLRVASGSHGGPL